MEKPTLQEAKNKYPIGTIFSNRNLGMNCDNIEVIGTVFYYDGKRIMIKTTSSKRKGYTESNYTVYSDGVWANVSNSTNTNYDYEIY